MLLLIDNYDSFTYNLYQYLSELNEEVKVVRNDKITIAQIEKMKPERIVISPGPSTPLNAGVSNDVIRNFGPKVPILGVCLGHQCIGYSFGGEIIRAKQIMHGKSSLVHHNGKGIFNGIVNPLSAIRYHSLTVERETLPDCFEVTAWTDDGTIMGLRHRQYPIEGVQFHPESFMTQNGKEILRNFLATNRQNQIKEAIQKLVTGCSISSEEAAGVMDEIMSGVATPSQFGAFVTALRVKGETVDEIIGLARTMRAKAINVPVDIEVVDSCGTGGDGAHTFNISTGAALVAAGAGVMIAKHGNRAMSSQCGSADVLEALNVKVDLKATQVKKCIETVGIGFIYAPIYHPAMKYAAAPRKEIGVRTVFNILGPLTNPAGAKAQVIGVPEEGLLTKMAQVLKGLGCRHALVVHGEGGLDEITNTGKTFICELKGGTITGYSIQPEDYGITRAKLDRLKGGNASDNARILRSVLSGEKGSRRDVVLMNAAAIILVSGKVNTLQEGLKVARKAIDSGNALKKLERLIEFTNMQA